jgi:hypothetical protein
MRGGEDQCSARTVVEPALPSVSLARAEGEQRVRAVVHVAVWE